MVIVCPHKIVKTYKENVSLFRFAPIANDFLSKDPICSCCSCSSTVEDIALRERLF